MPWNIVPNRVEKRAWLSRKWVQAGQGDVQWVSSSSEVCLERQLFFSSSFKVYNYASGELKYGVILKKNLI